MTETIGSSNYCVTSAWGYKFHRDAEWTVTPGLVSLHGTLALAGGIDCGMEDFTGGETGTIDFTVSSDLTACGGSGSGGGGITDTGLGAVASGVGCGRWTAGDHRAGRGVVSR